ncbi:MAG: PAS domain S-box protein [Candidatus Velamenicoccus archaeovorus]
MSHGAGSNGDGNAEEAIPPRGEAYEGLRGLGEPLRSFLEHLSQAVLGVDADGSIRFLNPRAGELFGYGPQELVGRPVEVLLPEAVRSGHQRYRGEFLRSGRAHPMESRSRLVARRRDGAEIQVEIGLSPLPLEGGPMAVAVVLDVSARHRAEQAAARAAERLALLHEIDRQILSLSPTEDIAQLVVRRIRQLVGCRRASVALFDHETGAASTFAVDTDAETAFPAGVRMAIEDFGGVAELSQGRIRVVDDLDTAEDRAPVEERLRREGLRSIAQVPIRVQERLLGSVNLAHDTPAFFDDELLGPVREAADQLAVGFYQTRLRREAEARAEELRQMLDALRRVDQLRRTLLSRLVGAQEGERRLIAREVHDDVVQVMSAVGMRLRSLRNRVEGDAGASLEELEETVTLAIGRLRNLLFDLHPPSLEQPGGFRKAMAVVLEALERDGGIAVEVDDRMEPVEAERVGPGLRATMYRIARQALTNVRRHARARHVHVTYETRGEGMLVRIRDDGVGFDPTAVSSGPPGHLGLVSMEERARLAGGWWTIDSAPGRGTTVEFWVPMAGDRADPVGDPTPPEG